MRRNLFKGYGERADGYGVKDGLDVDKQMDSAEYTWLLQ